MYVYIYKYIYICIRFKRTIAFWKAYLFFLVSLPLPCCVQKIVSCGVLSRKKKVFFFFRMWKAKNNKVSFALGSVSHRLFTSGSLIIFFFFTLRFLVLGTFKWENDALMLRFYAKKKMTHSMNCFRRAPSHYLLSLKLLLLLFWHLLFVSWHY